LDATSITKDAGWKIFLLVAYGIKSKPNIERCPETWWIVQIAHLRKRAPMRASVAPSFLQANREQPSARLFELSRESARIRGPSESIWRAKSPDAAAIHSSTPMRDLAMTRPRDLVWRASPSGAGVGGDLPRHGPVALRCGVLHHHDG
jgi:hypothetical protein